MPFAPCPARENLSAFSILRFQISRFPYSFLPRVLTALLRFLISIFNFFSPFPLPP